MTEKNVSDMRDLADKFSRAEMATIQVNINTQLKIPMVRLGSPDSVGSIQIAPSQTVDGSVFVPAQAVQITLYGARICSELVKANQNLGAAVSSILGDLFAP